MFTVGSSDDPPKDAGGDEHVTDAGSVHAAGHAGTPSALQSTQPRREISSLGELLDEEEHEVSIRRRRVRHKRAADSASKMRRSSRLAAKEDPFYVDATTKASRAKADQMDLAKASERMKAALHASGTLRRPAPPKISAAKLRCLGHVCGLAHLSEVEDEEAIVV